MNPPPAAATAGRATSADAADPQIASIERPASTLANAPGFGSDVVADTLRALDIPYIALNPGASYRGLHDSIVNYLGNEKPQMLLCLHEESAVAIAHGYAKVTGRAMAAAVHSNVGLMHATMAIFNAWCDRAPVLVIGATGPVDAMKRRPWIDWIHTARDQGALIRPYTKWDDQPASPGAAQESLLRATWIANTQPQGPVYVNLDAEMQEEKLHNPVKPLDPKRYMPDMPLAPAPELIKTVAALLKAAKHPVILAGRGSRSVDAWHARVALAEALNARVLTDLKIAAAFPTDHPLCAGVPGTIAPTGPALEALQKADVILSLDWVDLASAVKSLDNATIVQASLDHRVHNGWSMDHQGLPPVDHFLSADPDRVVFALLAELGVPAKPAKPYVPTKVEQPTLPNDVVLVEHLARALKREVGDREMTLTHLPLSWNGGWWPFRHPLDYLGSDGGGGVGGGPGHSVGAALALKGSGRLPIAICGDGDTMMGITALWTAAHYRIPLLLVVANNRSFYNDEVHQERMARMRHRPVENKWIGQRIADPDIDIAAMARAQGAVAFGPVLTQDELRPVFAQAIAAVEAGGIAVVDVRVEPGYTPAMTAALTRSSD
ncbi:MAG: acetolactate synthase [Xanthobacteraceae bacterium]|nr:acetolactate synthase [Xanthobacteraceae bacterium]